MEEMRSSPRFKINQLIAYVDDREEYLHADGLDISRGGIKCSSPRAVDPMTDIYVMMKVPSPGGEHLVRCEGYVSHSTKTAEACVFGVCISSIEPEDQPYFDAYIASLAAAGSVQA